MATPRRDALNRFADELIRLRTLAGKPSLNQLVKLTAGLPHPLARSTVSDKLTAKSVPDWDFVVSFVTGCRLHAAKAGVALEADAADLTQWETAHWRMLSDLDSGQGEDRLAVAARIELGRHADRGAPAITSSPVVRHADRHDGELPRLAGLLDELRVGAGGTVVISVIGGPANSEKGALLMWWAHQVADQFPDRPLYANLFGFDPGDSILDVARAMRGFMDAVRGAATADDGGT
jgi:hypothetical protein